MGFLKNKTEEDMKNKSNEKIVMKALSKAKYKYSDPCKRDILNVLKSYRGLSPEVDVFVFNNGDERNLLNVNGTIPVEYKGATYNIPICFWILDEYPTQAPLCYVKPTPDMQIKISNNVDSTGLISLPYLSEWKYPESSLQGIIQVCTVVFGQAPPVFSKPQPKLIQRIDSTESPGGGGGGGSTANSISTTTTTTTTTSIEFDNQLRASLLTALEDKLKSKLDEEVSKTKAELDSLTITNKELLDGQEKIQEIIKEVENKISEIEIHTLALSEKNCQMEEALRELSEMGDEIDTDKAIVVTDPLHKQILNAFVEDSAADDAIYILGEALRQGRIDTESYLKKVRNLSRKQFMHRALMDKCRAISGLN